MTEPSWDDDRLNRAFRSRFGGRTPGDLAAATVAAVHRDSARPGRRPLWSIAVAAALIVAVVGASQALQLRVGPTGATARGLPVLTVADALELHSSGARFPIAVRGYLSLRLHVRCPPPRSSARNPVRLDCPSQFGWLLDRPEPLGEISSVLPEGRRGFHPVFPGLDLTALAADRYGADKPVEVVLVGHFHDRRAIPSLCDDPDPAACDSFVVDAIHSIAGIVQATSTVQDLEPYEGEERPELAWSADEATQRAREIVPAIDVLSRVALPGHRVAELEPSIGTGLHGIIDAPVVWWISGLDPSQATQPRLRTLLLIDGTSRAYEATESDASGFVAVAPSLRPSPGDPVPPHPEPSFPSEVLGLPDGVNVLVADRVGMLVEAHPIDPASVPLEFRVPSNGGFDETVWLRQPQPDRLMLRWTGTPCDTKWIADIVDDRPSVELDHPPIGACPAVPAERAIELVFDREFDLDDVAVRVVTPYQP